MWVQVEVSLEGDVVQLFLDEVEQTGAEGYNGDARKFYLGMRDEERRTIWAGFDGDLRRVVRN